VDAFASLQDGQRADGMRTRLMGPSAERLEHERSPDVNRPETSAVNAGDSGLLEALSHHLDIRRSVAW